MSSYSFSHQFYQRWTCAPELVRSAIIQELTDITTLLQPETSFEDFVFDTHDLDAHLDELYDNHYAEQAIAKAIADKEAKDAKTQQQQDDHQLESGRSVTEVDDPPSPSTTTDKTSVSPTDASDTVDTVQTAEDEAPDNQAIAHDAKDRSESSSVEGGDADEDHLKNTDQQAQRAALTSPQDDEGSNAPMRSDHTNQTQDSNAAVAGTGLDTPMKAVADAAYTHTAIQLGNTTLSADHEDLIRELESNIDDYVSDQMMQISENLKSWLRAEVTERLASDTPETRQ